jgi:hypothetical protein
MQPGGFNPKGEDWIARKFAEMEKELRELKAADPYAPMGMKPMADGVEFSGNMKVAGTLDLPAGIIGNAALTDPLVIETSGVSQNSFGIGTSPTTFALGSVEVPTGYSRASILCMVVGGALNSTGAMDYLYVSSSINGSGGGESPQPALAGGYATTSANGIRTLTGLNGGTITLGCRIRTNTAAWASNGSNFANMNAVVYFSR